MTEPTIEILAARLQRLGVLVDELHVRLDQPDPAPTMVGEWGSLHEWVTGYLIPILELQPSNVTRWCTQWTEHPAAVARLDACWNAWQHLHTTPGPGMSTWFRDHLDPCLTNLTAPHGPFAACTPTEGRHTPAPDTGKR